MSNANADADADADADAMDRQQGLGVPLAPTGNHRDGLLNARPATGRS